MSFDRRTLLAAALLWPVAIASAAAETVAPTPRASIVVASTTSTQDSGLFGHILPLFTAETGIEVKVIALGTGQALDTARRGDADVVFVHARAAEEAFVAEGFAEARRPVMYNDFVLIGPKADPAGIKGASDIVAALTAIRARAVPFVSRGDRSGTHQAEIALWKTADVDIAAAEGEWYREIGQGMGAALNTAGAMGAYVLADRGTWIGFRNKGDLDVVVAGDRRLFNQYGIMLVSPARHPHVKAEAGMAFVDWMVSPKGQQAIGSYAIDGQRLFFPNADQPGA